MATLKEAKKKLDSLLKKQSAAVQKALSAAQAAADLSTQIDTARAELADAEAAAASAAPAPAPAPKAKATKTKAPPADEEGDEME